MKNLKIGYLQIRYNFLREKIKTLNWKRSLLVDEINHVFDKSKDSNLSSTEIKNSKVVHTMIETLNQNKRSRLKTINEIKWNKNQRKELQKS